LTRDSGEDPGTYPIQQGTLTANGNYYIDSFQTGTLTIGDLELDPDSDPDPFTVTASGDQELDDKRGRDSYLLDGERLVASFDSQRIRVASPFRIKTSG
ncbi:MAG: MBG domain-containing protein, partial [Gemmataceae bacterium]